MRKAFAIFPSQIFYSYIYRFALQQTNLLDFDSMHTITVNERANVRTTIDTLL